MHLCVVSVVDVSEDAEASIETTVMEHNPIATSDSMVLIREKHEVHLLTTQSG